MAAPQLLMLAGMLIANAPPAVQPIVACEGISNIDAFAGEIDARLEGMEIRTFAETYSDRQTIWREVKPGAGNPGTSASVFFAGRLPVAAFFTIQTLSGDWVLYANYYFRPDGSLAKRHEQLNTFHTHASVIRDEWFGCQGEAYGGSARHLDLKTKQPKPPDPESFDLRAPLFMRVRSLPFFPALGSH